LDPDEYDETSKNSENLKSLALSDYGDLPQPLRVTSPDDRSVRKAPPPRAQSPPIQLESDFSQITTPSSTNIAPFLAQEDQSPILRKPLRRSSISKVPPPQPQEDQLPSFRQPPRRSSISKVPPPRAQSPPIQIESDFSHITTPSSTSKTRYSLNKAPTQQQGTSVEDVIERAMDELDRHSPRQKQDEPLKRVTSLSPKKRPPPPKR